MAYIIAHGTVDGYRKIPQTTQKAGDELHVITDIRAEFDNTSTMLDKPMGYLIQLSPNGVWVSVVKLLFDGERSGNGPGFFAFSAYLPSVQIIEGAKLKKILDDLMTKYLSMLTRDYFTRNIGVDWSFVEQASAELDSLCKPQAIKCSANFVVSEKFAYVNADTDEQIIKYLGKPFQPEYGAFKAIFIGTQIQNPNRQSSHSLLNLDLDNEVYSILWIGNKDSSIILPQMVRKRQIDQSVFRLEKKHYHSIDIPYNTGIRDDLNATITIPLPKLEPIVYHLNFIVNPQEAVMSINATLVGGAKRVHSNDNHSLEFLGDDVEKPWRVNIQACDDYQDKTIDEIIPLDFIKVNTESGEYGVPLSRVRQIQVDILLKDKPVTKDYYDKLKFLNVRTSAEEMPWDKQQKKLLFKIPEDLSFNAIYKISLKSPYDKSYQCEVREVHDTLWTIMLSPTQGCSKPIQNSNRDIFVYCPDSIISEGIVSYEYPGCPLGRLVNELDSEEKGTRLYKIVVPRTMHRNQISFYNHRREKINSTIEGGEGDNVIRLGKKSFIARIGKLLYKNKSRLAIIGGMILGIIVVALLGFLTARQFGVNPFKWSAQDNADSIANSQGDDSTQMYTPEIASPIQPTAAPNEHSDTTYNQLKNVLQNPKDKWNKDEIYKIVNNVAGPKGCKTDSLKKNDASAYKALKQLGWLWKTRDALNKCDWGRLNDLTAKDNEYVSNKYHDNEKLKFLRELIDERNTNARKKFEDDINNDDNFKDKSFTQIKQIWKKCQDASPKSGNSSASEGTPITEDGIM